MKRYDRRAILRQGVGLGAVTMLPACATPPPGGAGIADSATPAGRVTTIEALRAISPMPGTVVDVAGYWSPGDGGGGLFTWIGDDSHPEDCGTVIAPTPVASAGRWHREAHDRLEFSWFGPRGDGETDDAPALDRAIRCATRTGLPLVLNPGTYLLATDVRATIGDGENLDISGDGAIFRRIGPTGTLKFDAERIGFLPVTDSILPGGDGLQVEGAHQARVGDLIEVRSGLRLTSARNSSWTATEYARVAAIRGDRLILDAPTRNRVHPNRRLAYRMDGQTNVLHYRLFWADDADGIQVLRDGAQLSAGRDFTVSGSNDAGYDITLAETPPADTEIVLRTRDPIYAGLFRGGRLKVSGLTFVSDFDHAGAVTFLDSVNLAPAHSHFTDIDMTEHNPPVGDHGYSLGHSGDLFRVGLIDSLVENVHVRGGRYAVMVLRGRNATYRNIVGENCWHPIASFGAQRINIQNVTAIHCVAAVDSHYSFEQHVDGIEGIACQNGIDHRATGGSVRNATMVDNTSSDSWGLNFGVAQGAPDDDPLLADPQDIPRNMFTSAVSGLANDLEFADCAFAAPNDPGGYGLFGGYLRRLVLRNVTFDGPLIIGDDPPTPVRELLMDRFRCRYLTPRGVTDRVAGVRVTTAQLDLTRAGTTTVQFEDSLFDGALDGRQALIDDDVMAGAMAGTMAGAMECHFHRCTFRNAPRLFTAHDPEGLARTYVFHDCTFAVGDTAGYG